MNISCIPYTFSFASVFYIYLHTLQCVISLHSFALQQFVHQLQSSNHIPACMAYIRFCLQVISSYTCTRLAYACSGGMHFVRHAQLVFALATTLTACLVIFACTQVCLSLMHMGRHNSIKFCMFRNAVFNHLTTVNKIM